MTEQPPLMDRITDLKDPIKTLWGASNALNNVVQSDDLTIEVAGGLIWLAGQIDSAMCRLQERYDDLHKAAGGDKPAEQPDA